MTGKEEMIRKWKKSMAQAQFNLRNTKLVSRLRRGRRDKEFYTIFLTTVVSTIANHTMKWHEMLEKVQKIIETTNPDDPNLKKKILKKKIWTESDEAFAITILYNNRRFWLATLHGRSNIPSRRFSRQEVTKQTTPNETEHDEDLEEEDDNQSTDGQVSKNKEKQKHQKRKFRWGKEGREYYNECMKSVIEDMKNHPDFDFEFLREQAKLYQTSHKRKATKPTKGEETIYIIPGRFNRRRMELEDGE